MTPILLIAGVLLVALLYSSVGHGGASGYLALMRTTGMRPEEVSSAALLLNLLVSSVGFVQYARAGHFSWRTVWPFLIGSVPFAFIGGLIKISDRTFDLLLAAVLIWAAIRMAWPSPRDQPEAEEPAPKIPAIAIGIGIGLLSGIVGVGGGIFLSPLMILFRWASARKTAAASALFILVNSAAGMGGRLAQGKLVITETLPWLLAAALVGGLIGSSIGAHRFSTRTLRLVLAAVLILAPIKLVQQHL
jgi:uncharacterized protein